MKPTDIKIERTLALTGPQWDALITACYLGLHDTEALTFKFPVKYSVLQSNIAACYAALLKSVFGDEVLASET